MCAVDGGKFSGYAADLWSAGVCLYVFTTGRLPFFSLIPSELFELIAKADIDYDKLHLSDELKDLLQMMLKKDPASRAGVGDALQHEFCSKARIQRVKQLGREFQQSDHNIILTNDDVDMAFSVTMLSDMFHKKHPKQHNAKDGKQPKSKEAAKVAPPEAKEKQKLPPTLRPFETASETKSKPESSLSENWSKSKKKMKRRSSNSECVIQ
eukprot:g6996.t1 g6996   contig23:1656047-1656750(-)